MKKLFLCFILFLFTFHVYSLNLNSEKISYDRYEIMLCMKKYHEKYGRGDVNYVTMYTTILYWSNQYDIDLAFALSFFAIESGFTYECASNQNALGVGQVTEVALKDYNAWYGKEILLKDLNNKKRYDINIMVALGYIRMCWDRYSIIKNGEDLIKSYNVGIGNLKKIKNGEYSSDNYWTMSANK